MSGETSITIIGNLTNDPELRFTTNGSAVANFTIASTPRTFDPQTREWKDGETLFLRATVWRDAAENAAAALAKGSRVVASGVLKPRTYETKAGEKRTVIELEVDEIGLSLKYTAATPTRVEANHSRGNAGEVGEGGEDTYRPVGAGVPNPYFADDDPWFGKDANPSGRVTIPGATSGPSF